MTTLHAAIMNLPVPDEIERMGHVPRNLWKEGHKHARHAAAELVSAALSAPAVPQWQSMRTAPKNGWAVLVLVEGSDIPRAARWLRGTDDPHATEETTGPGWHLTWDGTPIAEHEGPRYWMHCPEDPDDPQPQEPTNG